MGLKEQICSDIDVTWRIYLCTVYRVWLKEHICSGIDLTWRIYLCTVGIRSVFERTDMFWYRSNLENISMYCRYTEYG